MNSAELQLPEKLQNAVGSPRRKKIDFKENCMCVLQVWGGNFPEEGMAFESDFRVMAWFGQIEAGLMD